MLILQQWSCKKEVERATKMVSRRYPTQKKNHTKKDREDYVADIIEMEGSHHILYLQVTLGTLVLTLREIGREFAQRRDCTVGEGLSGGCIRQRKESEVTPGFIG